MLQGLWRDSLWCMGGWGPVPASHLTSGDGKPQDPSPRNFLRFFDSDPIPEPLLCSSFLNSLPCLGLLFPLAWTALPAASASALLLPSPPSRSCQLPHLPQPAQQFLSAFSPLDLLLLSPLVPVTTILILGQSRSLSLASLLPSGPYNLPTPIHTHMSQGELSKMTVRSYGSVAPCC